LWLSTTIGDSLLEIADPLKMNAEPILARAQVPQRVITLQPRRLNYVIITINTKLKPVMLLLLMVYYKIVALDESELRNYLQTLVKNIKKYLVLQAL
jgi:hypothetical protein